MGYQRVELLQVCDRIQLVSVCEAEGALHLRKIA
jgi:hypothetical protein